MQLLKINLRLKFTKLVQVSDLNMFSNFDNNSLILQ